MQSASVCVHAYFDDVLVRATLVRFVVFRILQKHFVHIGARVLEKLIRAVEYDQRDLTVTQHAKLIRLLHQAELALRECHLIRKVRCRKERLNCRGILYAFMGHIIRRRTWNGGLIGIS